MYHFATAEGAESLKLSRTTEVPKHICQYLKSFQTSAIHFLFNKLTKHEFCILNDESGLGKCASVATLFGQMATDKKCLIVVANDGNLITGWQFHFSVLTNLSTTIINTADDATDTTHNVYIAKWNTLRALGTLNDNSFDYVLIDNRGEMLNNAFCAAMLIKRYEKKVNILLSSTDITSDLKLMHNVLRLGGRLDNEYENYKVFEEKFKLPDLKEVLNKKADLEDYYLRREILSDYCKDFRLRRYRHQYGDLLPLVAPDRYKINLELWHHTTEAVENSEKSVEMVNTMKSISVPKEKKISPEKTQNTTHENDTRLHNDVWQMSWVNIGENLNETCSDDPVLMSPLLVVSDSETEEDEPIVNSQEIVAISGESKDDHEDSCVTELPLAAVPEDSNTTQNQTKSKRHKLRSQHKNVQSPDQIQIKSNCQERKTSKTKDLKSNKSIESSSFTDEKPATRSRRSVKTNATTTNTKSTELNLAVKVKRVNMKGNNRKIVENTNDLDASTSRETRTSKVENKRNNNQDSKEEKQKSKPISTSEGKSNSSNASAPKKVTASKKNGNTTGACNLIETRLMKRMTRSSGKINSKYMKSFHRNVNVNKKPGKKGNSKKMRNQENEFKENDKSEQVDKVAAQTTIDHSTNCLKTSKEGISEEEKDKTQKNRNKSSQTSVISVSDYEDIQCGQKLTLESNSENNAVRMFEKMNQFLIPPTPTLPSTLLLSESEITFIPQAAQPNQDVIVLSSSQDECSVSSVQSQSRRTRALKQKLKFTRIRPGYEKRAATFGELLARQAQRESSKSPDLFSNCSDVGITCTQANNKTTFDGFKIFGSEVKQLQQQHALSAKELSAKSPRERSCLDILENMFEARNEKNSNSLPTQTKRTQAKTPILPSHPIEAIAASQTDVGKNNDKRATSSNNQNDILEDEIFEITNNRVFGSRMRLNSNGDVSPVQQPKTPQGSQHNKITNYLIGATQTSAGHDEQVDATPHKKTQLSGTGARKSPKSRQTQATKLTRWFLRNSTDSGREHTPEEVLGTNNQSENNLETKEKTDKKTKSAVKRRRLDLSFNN